MNKNLTTYQEYDQAQIFKEQQAALKNVYSLTDLSKIAFVGGVADYINLRPYYEMLINDLDIIYKEEEDLQMFIKKNDIKRYTCKFYKFNSQEVLVAEYLINGKRVHIDYYRRNFSVMKLTQSYLLGVKVWHASFGEMKKFHNDQIGRLTSAAMGKDYDWKRLYKHSKKASLYNNVDYLEEKDLIHTLKENVHEPATKDYF